MMIATKKYSYEVKMQSYLKSLFFSKKNAWIMSLLAFVLVGSSSSCSKVNMQNSHEEKTMEFQIPQSLNSEHEELHRSLEKAIESGGKTSEAAKIVADHLHQHFKNEEAYALPQLALLGRIAEGKVTAEMKDAIKLSDKLKAEMPQMLEEHKAIVAALNDLSNAAKSENKAEAVEFAEKLKLHAQNEEEVLYPAAILVGEYLKLRFKE